MPLNYRFNWQTIGHEKLLQTLEYFIINKKLAHAYLFYGKNNLGKTYIAKKFITNLFCFDYHQKNKTINTIFPCGECLHCRQLQKNIHPDFLEVTFAKDEEKGKNKKNISVEQIRQLHGSLYTAKLYNSYKAVIISQAHLLSENAFNSLLKILEEPPEEVILVLISDDLTKIPKTIISRCQLLQFFPINRNKIKTYLHKQQYSNERADQLANLSNGETGTLFKFLKDTDSLQEYETNALNFLRFLTAPKYEQFNFINQFVEKTNADLILEEDLKTKLNIWASVLRDLLLLKFDIAVYTNNKIILEQLQKSKLHLPPAKLVLLIKKIDEIKRLLKHNINCKLALENFLLLT